MAKWTRWRIVEVKSRLYIKRSGLGDNTGKNQNYPIKKYKHIQNDIDEMSDLILRLNHTEDEKRRQKYIIENAFIPQKYVDDYAEFLEGEHTRNSVTKNILSPFIRYGLKKLQTYDPNPSNWPEYEKEWGNYLLNKGLSKSYILGISQNINRFLKYTHERNRRTFPMISLKPVSTIKLNRHEEKRLKQLNVDGKRDPFGYYISIKDRKLIFKHLSTDIKSTVLLMDLYGLRESESLGLAFNKKCLTTKNLLIDMQLVSVGRDCQDIETDLPKWRKKRKVPHWHKKDLKKVVELIKTIRPMHPDTLIKKFRDCVTDIGLEKIYTLHDLRRTWITDMFADGHMPMDIKDAAGHTQLSTTEKYWRKEDEDEELIDL